MKSKKLIMMLLFLLFVLIIGAVSAANDNDTIVSSDIAEDSISQPAVNNIDADKGTNTILNENKCSKKINDKDKQSINEIDETSIKSSNNGEPMGDTSDTWTDIKYCYDSGVKNNKDVFEVQLGPTEINLGEPAFINISHNDGAYSGNYISIFVDDTLYKRTTLFGTTCKSINNGIYGLTEGQHKIEFKREYGKFDMTIWGIKESYTSYSPPFYITVKSISSTPNTYSSTVSHTTSKSITKKSTVKNKKVISKISVKSFTTHTGTKFSCYAYVWSKKDRRYINGGYVKFKIKGKTYKAKLKNGVAIAKFKVTKKPGKYICKAQYIGGKNIKSSKTKFKMVVKQRQNGKIVKIGKYKCKITSKQYKNLKMAYKNDVNMYVTYAKANKKYHKVAIFYFNGWNEQDLRSYKRGFYADVWDTRYEADGYKIQGKRVHI